MGIPGAGKSPLAEEYVARGYVRLNRDERGGSLRALAVALEEELAAPEPRVVLDNTYLTRASRSYVLDAAARHGAPVRCVWLDTPLAQAQVNLIARLLDRFGHLPDPDELRELAKREPGVLAPTRRCAPSASSSRLRSTRGSSPSSGSSSRACSTAERARASSSQRRRCGRTAGLPRGTPRISCSTGSLAAAWMRSPRKSSVSPRTSRAPSRRRSALIPAVRRRAGAGRRYPD